MARDSNSAEPRFWRLVFGDRRGEMSTLIISSLLSGGLGVLLGWALARRFAVRRVSWRYAIVTSFLQHTVIPYKPLPGKMKLVLVVRTDLNMGKGKVAAQVCSHATLCCYEYALEDCPAVLQAWERQGQPKIVLKAGSLEELESLSAKADSLGLVNAIIHDAGHTQVAEGTATVLGIGPGMRVRAFGGGARTSDHIVQNTPVTDCAATTPVKALILVFLLLSE
ncbi:unnamed protein product [Echinostoma caproni]|uniref:peptidyl-tRNA hydrolase n=1 Tax=Echinostoma caproni TaxID=27848 RepID=A0A183AL49_9TREM|nr:unnamed protein product [Echinostoma caproni]